MNRISEIITYFFEHDFSSETVKKVHQRLAEEDYNEKEVEQAMEKIWNTINNTPAMDEKELNKAWQCQRDHLYPPRKRCFYIKWARIAALWIVPLVLATTSFYMFHETNSIKQDIAHITFKERHVPDGEIEVFTLPDGSTVTLNSRSSLIYPTKFLKEKREVFLSGEGHFCVARDEKCPFYVNTTPIKVKVLGTKFNVNVYPDNKEAIATLEQGSVGIFINGQNEVGDGCILVPNEQFVYNKETGKVVKRKIDSKEYTSWKSGELTFMEKTLSEIIPVLERRYKVFIYVKSDLLYKDVITIRLNKNESLENVLKLIQQVIPGMQFKIKGENVYLTHS